MLIAFGPDSRQSDLQSDDIAFLERHLTGCQACQLIAQDEARFDASVRSLMTDLPVPASLQSRLHSIQFSRRGAELRRIFYRGMTLAAIVAVSVMLTGGYLWRTRPELDAEKIVYQVEQERDNREDHARQWLVALGLPDSLPLDFDFRYEVFHGNVEFEGARNVPLLIFSRDQQFARVYVIQNHSMDASKLTDVERSQCKVMVKQHPTRPGITYLIIHSDNLNALLKQPLSNLPPV